MKSKNEKKDSLFQTKGFYAALYSCVGIVLVLAAVIAYNARNNTIQSPVAPNGYSAAEPIEPGEMQSTLSQTTRSYLTPEDAGDEVTADAQAEEEVVFFRPKTSEPPSQPAVTPAPSTTQETPPVNTAPAKEEAPAQTQESAPETPTSGSSEAAPEEELPYEAAEVIPSGLDGVPISSSEYEVAASGETYSAETIDEILSEPVFSIFGDDQEMIWPVTGEIVMDYSVDRTVYDQTLEQFRTNNSISIAAAAGTPVKAAAEGFVREISNTRENGVSVTIDHGNGWTTTYSQLGEALLVAEGDVLLRGQEFAVVGNPSIYSVLLGEHLGFSVTKNDASRDPKTVLAALE